MRGVCMCVCVFVCVHMCVRAHVCHSACVEVKGHLVRVISFLPPCGSQGSNSAWMLCQQIILLAEPSFQFFPWNFDNTDKTFYLRDVCSFFSKCGTVAQGPGTKPHSTTFQLHGIEHQYIKNVHVATLNPNNYLKNLYHCYIYLKDR